MQYMTKTNEHERFEYIHVQKADEAVEYKGYAGDRWKLPTA